MARPMSPARPGSIASRADGARCVTEDRGCDRLSASRAGVTQLAECQLPKLNVAGSNPVSRSTSLPDRTPGRARHGAVVHRVRGGPLRRGKIGVVRVTPEAYHLIARAGSSTARRSDRCPNPRGPISWFEGVVHPVRPTVRHRAASLIAVVILLAGLLPVVAAMPVAAADPAPAHRFLSDDRHDRLDETPPKGAQFAAASTTLTGFSDTNVWTGLTLPTAVRFAPDGRVFVAEKSGIIKVFDSLTDTTPTVFADLRDQGPRLLGPRPARAWRSTRTSRPARTSTSLYTYDAAIGGRPRRAGTTRCPTPPGPDHRRLRGQRPAVAPDGGRRRRRPARAGPDRRTGASSSRATPSATCASGRTAPCT